MAYGTKSDRSELVFNTNRDLSMVEPPKTSFKLRSGISDGFRSAGVFRYIMVVAFDFALDFPAFFTKVQALSMPSSQFSVMTCSKLTTPVQLSDSHTSQ
jgi:hypothetical protein